MKKIRGRLTFANVVSALALFIALGGASYAATQLPKNSVGTAQVKNRSITLAKLSRGARSALAGPRGAQGERGLQGPGGVTRVTSRFGNEVTTGPEAPLGFIAAFADCAPGEVAVGGGYQVRSGGEDPEVWVNSPTEGNPPTGWAVHVRYEKGVTHTFRAHVLCAAVP